LAVLEDASKGNEGELVKRALALFFALVMAAFTNAIQARAQEPKTDAFTVAAPTAFPAPGTYPTTNSVTLLSATFGAEVHYTLDGTQPTHSSPTFDPYKLLWVGAVNNGDAGLKTGYTIRAIAIKPGMKDSEAATFQYTIDRRDRTAYVAEDILPGVVMVRDYANDKMFLVKGSKKSLLIDSGMGTGDLKGFLAPYVGGLPLEVAFTHFHGDHTGQSDKFIGDSVEYINEADRSHVAASLREKGVSQDTIDKNLRNIKDDDILDLGDRKLIVYQVPGHTPGSIVLFEKETGYLFTGDSIGSNGPGIPDAFWLHLPSSPPLDEYLSTLEVFRSKVKSGVKHIMTGHNDHPMEGEKYLDNLQHAAQSVVDRGTSVLVPSLRPPGVWQVVVGDRMHDPNWVSINVTREGCLSAAPEKITALSNLELNEGPGIDFSPARLEYNVSVGKNVSKLQITPTAMSSSYKSLKINGRDAKSGTPFNASLKRGTTAFAITVTSPDGNSEKTYTLTVIRTKQ
jgi:glyoxylase-like metal-dependent hydrolase (beta-lactamase superfamily II)